MLASRLASLGARRVLIGCLVALLSACQVDAAVEITTDRAGAGTVTVTITADAEIVQAAPELATDIRLADLAAAGWAVVAPTATPDGGLQLVLQRVVTTPADTTAVLAQLSGPDGPFQNLTVDQKRSFANITTTLNGSIQVRGGLAAFVDNQIVGLLGGEPYRETLAERNLTLEQVFKLRLIATTPGTVRSTNGRGSPTVGRDIEALSTVEWQADLTSDAAQPVSLESALRDAGAQNARRWRDFAPWAAAAWGAFFLGVVLPAVSLISRARRRSAARS